MTDTLSLATAPARKDQASALLAHAAGYASHRTIAMGLRGGLLEELGRDPAGATADELAERLDLDPGYVAAWRRSALSAGVCERDSDRFRFAPHMTTLLLDRGSAAYVGGVVNVLEQPEMFGLRGQPGLGGRLWWDGCSPDWIAGVAGTGTRVLHPAGPGRARAGDGPGRPAGRRRRARRQRLRRRGRGGPAARSPAPTRACPASPGGSWAASSSRGPDRRPAPAPRLLRRSPHPPRSHRPGFGQPHADARPDMGPPPLLIEARGRGSR